MLHRFRLGPLDPTESSVTVSRKSHRTAKMGNPPQKRRWGEHLGDYTSKPPSSRQKRRKTSNEHPKKQTPAHQIRSIPQSTWFKEFSTRRLVLPFEHSPPSVVAQEHSDFITEEELNDSSEFSFLNEIASIKAEESDRILQSSNLTLTEHFFQDFLDHVEMAGPTPPIDSCKSIHLTKNHESKAFSAQLLSPVSIFQCRMIFSSEY